MEDKLNDMISNNQFSTPSPLPHLPYRKRHVDYTHDRRKLLSVWPCDKVTMYTLNGNSYQFGSWDRITRDHLVSAPIPVEDIGEWVHLVGTYDGVNWNLYKNGELLASRADTVGCVPLTTNWYVGNTTTYTYNYMGLVATETNEKNATRYYSYDALGRLVSKTDRNGRITTYTYDTIGRLTSENWGNTTNYFMYTYDAVGNLLYATDGQHSYSYTYDALNRPIYTTFNFDSQSAVFAYTYDLAGRRTSSSLSLNGHSDRVNQVTYDFLGNATKNQPDRLRRGRDLRRVRL